MSNEFKKAFKGIDSAVKQGTARALNRALSSTQSKVLKQLRADTGLKTEVLRTRTRFRKAKSDRLNVILGLATKFGMPLRLFKPSLKRIKKGSRVFMGVTVKIGQAVRQLVPGAFSMKLPVTTIVAGRTKAYTSLGSGIGDYSNPGAPSHPTTQLKTDVFAQSARAQQAGAKQYLVDTFDRIAEHEIDYAIQSKFNSDR